MSELDYRQILNAFADAVVMADGTGRITYVNQAAAQLLGWPERELVGRPLTAIIPTRLHAAHHAGFRRYLDTRVPQLIGRPVRVPALRRDGSEVEVDLTLAAFRTGERAGGAPVGGPGPGAERAGDLFVASLRDLRDRVELERQLTVTRYLLAANAAAAKLSSHRDLDAVLSTVVETLVTEFDAALARIWLYEEATNSLHLRASAGLSTDIATSSRARIDVASYPYKVGVVARTRQPFVQNGLAGDPHFDQGWVERENLKAVAAFPLLSGDELLGVSIYFSRQELQAEVVQVLTTFAALVTTAIHDVQLFQRAQAELAERRRAEAALRASEQRLSTTLRSIGDAVIATDRGGRIAFMNPVAEALTGWGEEEAVGKTLGEVFVIVNEQTRQMVEDPVTRVLREGQTVGLANHTVLVARDGRETAIDDSGAPIRDDRDHLVGVVLTFRDITERRRAETAQRESEDRIRQQLAELNHLYDTTPVGLGLVDTHLRYVRLNEQLAAINGTPIIAHLGRTLREVVPDIAPRVEPLYRQVIETGEPHLNIEVRGSTPADPTAERDFLVSYYPVRAVDGPVQGVGIVVQDITERKRMEEAQRFLVEASHVLTASLDYQTTLARVAQLSVPRLADWCAVDIVEADGSLRRLAVAHVDPAKVAMAKELQQRYPDDPNASRGLAQVLRTGQTDYLFEIPDALLAAAAQDAEHLRVLRELGLKSYICVPLLARGRTLGVLSFMTAESGRRYGPNDLALVEELARRAAVAIDNAWLYHEVQEAGRRKDEYLTMLAHELRNPLAPILNALQLLKQLGPAEPRLVRAEEIIDRQVHHQARLIDDLLDVTRINHGKVVLRRECLDLARLARDSAADHRSAMDQAGLTLQLSLPEEPVWVEGDTTRLAQVLDNLLTNAIKFTHTGGQVSVELGVQAFGRSGVQEGESERLNAVLIVHDNGIGIEAELLPHIFESFTQADRSLDRSRGGLGLGLALVKGLVELHGGQVRAESAGPGCGATFTVRLPMVPGTAAFETTASPAGAPSGPLRVLIVEDNRDAAESLRDLLELSGNTVTIAYSGPEALEAARQFRPEVVLCDLGLPGMDGYQVARALRRDPVTATASLIAVSGYGEEEDQRRSREAGFDLHLTKPVDFTDLQRVLEDGPEGG